MINPKHDTHIHPLEIVIIGVESCIEGQKLSILGLGWVFFVEFQWHLRTKFKVRILIC